MHTVTPLSGRIGSVKGSSRRESGQVRSPRLAVLQVSLLRAEVAADEAAAGANAPSLRAAGVFYLHVICPCRPCTSSWPSWNACQASRCDFGRM